MTGYPVVDVAIGLSFVFFVFSIFATAIVEGIAGVLRIRANTLEAWLAQNLRPASSGRAISRVRERLGASLPPEQQEARDVLRHPIVFGMTKGKSRPSYVPQNRFIIALLARDATVARDRLITAYSTGGNVQAVINNLPDGSTKQALNQCWEDAGNNLDAFKREASQLLADVDSLGDPQQLIDDLPEGPIKQAMESLWTQAGQDVKAFRLQAEAWFDQSMERLSGWYKRRTQLWLWIIGAIFALALDVDAIRIGNLLWHDQAVRQIVADQATQVRWDSSKVDPKKAADQLQSLPVPLGWEGWPSGLKEWTLTPLGLFLTSAAVSLGAPFWFDTLSKLANLRNTGPKPSAEPDVRALEDGEPPSQPGLLGTLSGLFGGGSSP